MIFTLAVVLLVAWIIGVVGIFDGSETSCTSRCSSA
jgi:hypothetical protein